MAAPERRPGRHARRNRIADRCAQRGPPSCTLALPLHLRAELRRFLRIDSRCGSRHRLRPGPASTSSPSTAAPAPSLAAGFARNDGPNGLAVDGRRVYGSTDADAFALSVATGKLLWFRHLATPASSSSTSRPLPGAGSSSRALSAMRRSAGERSMRSTPRPAPCAGSSTRSRTRGSIRSSRAAAACGTRSLSTRRGSFTQAPRTRRRGAARRRGRTAARSPARPVHRLLARARRAHRPAALARPGHGARRPRLRLPGDADPCACRRRRPRARSREGRARDRVGPHDEKAPLGYERRPAPERHGAPAATARDRLPRPLRRRRDAHGVRRRKGLLSRSSTSAAGEAPLPGRRSRASTRRRAAAASSRSTQQTGGGSGSGGCRRQTSAARPS